MARCIPHQQLEPCWYCERGMGQFTSTGSSDLTDAMQVRFKFLEKNYRNLLEAFNAAPWRVNEAPALVTAELPLNLENAIGVVRDYALGDFVMLAPALKALKEKNPGVPLYFVTRPELFGVLAGADYLDGQLPKAQYEGAKFAQRFDLSHAVECIDGKAGGKLSLKDYSTKSRPDVFAKLLGVSGGAEKFPVPVNEIALSKMRAIFQGCKRPLIAYSPTCGSAVRCMPTEYAEPIIKGLQEVYGGTVVLLGKTRNYTDHLKDLRMPGVVNLIDSTTPQELIAAIFLLDALISPDTGTMHVAGALGVHCLCLMGNNDPKTFSAFYQSVKTIQPTELKCVPCRDISHPCGKLPRGQVGAACMQAFTPERVLGEFRSFYNGKNIAYLHDTVLTYPGGAEITTKGMIKAGRERGFNIRHFDNETPLEHFYTLFGYDLIILSNIWRFSPEQMAVIMQAIKSVPYVKYSHDHDGLKEQALGKWPKEDYAKKIYGESALNIFVSPAHQEDYKDLASGICIPELLDLEMFQPVKGVKREPKSCLIAVPGKWGEIGVQDYIKKHPDLKVTVLRERVPHADMPALYSRFEVFAHYPQRKWPCDRVIFEAALCGCKIDAGKIVEALSWGKDLTDQKGLRKWLGEVPEQFWGMIDTAFESLGMPSKKVAHG